MNIIFNWYVTNEPEKWNLLVEKIINDLRKKYVAETN